MRILFLLHKIGPYHHARFSELATACDLIVAEILPASQEYDWKPINTDSNYQRIQMPTDKQGNELRGKALIAAIKAIIQHYRPQAIITMGWSNRTYMAALYAGKKEDIPVFSMSDSNYDDFKRYKLVECFKKQIVKGFDGFVTAGKRSEQYLNKFGVTSEYIFKPFDVVDNAHFMDKSVKLTTFDYSLPYILCISRYIPKKNLFTLIEAYHSYLSKHSEEKTLLYIVGSGPLETQLKTKIQTLNQQQIKLFPFVQYDELPSLYQHARGLILASTSEQWGLVVNEAMAAGIPVMVSNRCGCVDDLVVDGENGWIFEPTVDGIVEVLEKFFPQSSERLQQMGRKGQQIIENFDLKDHKIAVLSMIEKGSQSKRKLKGLQKLIVFLRIFL